MLTDLGTQVTILEALPEDPARLRPGRRRRGAPVVQERGIEVRTGVKVTGHTPERDGRSTTVQFGDGEEVTVEAVVVSVGRRPLVGPPRTGGDRRRVDRRGFVEVDERMRTGEPGVYAAGDLVDTPALAHVGFRRGGRRSSTRSWATPVVPVDYEKVPWCIYCHPEVAFAGLSEEAAERRASTWWSRRTPTGATDGPSSSASRRAW